MHFSSAEQRQSKDNLTSKQQNLTSKQHDVTNQIAESASKLEEKRTFCKRHVFSAEPRLRLRTEYRRKFICLPRKKTSLPPNEAENEYSASTRLAEYRRKFICLRRKKTSLPPSEAENEYSASTRLACGVQLVAPARNYTLIKEII